MAVFDGWENLPMNLGLKPDSRNTTVHTPGIGCAHPFTPSTEFAVPPILAHPILHAHLQSRAELIEENQRLRSLVSSYGIHCQMVKLEGKRKGTTRSEETDVEHECAMVDVRGGAKMWEAQQAGRAAKISSRSTQDTLPCLTNVNFHPIPPALFYSNLS